MLTPRRRRARQSGFTIIEMLVTISLMTLVIVGMVTDFAVAERTAGIGVVQAQAQVTMRHATDALRSNQLGYVCGNTGAAQTAYTSAVTAFGSAAQGVSVTVGGVTTVAGSNGPAVWDCTSGGAVTTCPGGDVCETGVQRIRVVVTYPNGTLTRTVFKGHS